MFIRMKVILSTVIFLLAARAYAAESQFGFIYTTDLLPKGEKEVEQWLTWRTQKVAGYFDMLEGRTSYEYGAADDIQLALYATYDWTRAYHNGPGQATTPPEQFGYDQPKADDHYNKSRFVGVSAEAIYRIWSPYIDPLGIALYMEPTFGSKFFEIENKIILQKNFLDDTMVFAFNYTYAPEFRLLPSSDGTSPPAWQEETDMNLNLGGSYRFMSNWSAGFEFLNEREFNGMGITHESNSGFYLGPSIHYGGKKFFLTAVLLEQLPWAGSHRDTVPGAVVNGRTFDNDFEKYRVRLKAGFYF